MSQTTELHTQEKYLFSPQILGWGGAFASGQQRWVGWMRWHPHRPGAEQHVMASAAGWRQRQTPCLVTRWGHPYCHGRWAKAIRYNTLISVSSRAVHYCRCRPADGVVDSCPGDSEHCCCFYPSKGGFGSACVSGPDGWLAEAVTACSGGVQTLGTRKPCVAEALYLTFMLPVCTDAEIRLKNVRINPKNLDCVFNALCVGFQWRSRAAGVWYTLVSRECSFSCSTELPKCFCALCTHLHVRYE